MYAPSVWSEESESAGELQALESSAGPVKGKKGERTMPLRPPRRRRRGDPPFSLGAVELDNGEREAKAKGAAKRWSKRE